MFINYKYYIHLLLIILASASFGAKAQESTTEETTETTEQISTQTSTTEDKTTETTEQINTQTSTTEDKTTETTEQTNTQTSTASNKYIEEYSGTSSSPDKNSGKFNPAGRITLGISSIARGFNNDDDVRKKFKNAKQTKYDDMDDEISRPEVASGFMLYSEIANNKNTYMLGFQFNYFSYKDVVQQKHSLDLFNEALGGQTAPYRNIEYSYNIVDLIPYIKFYDYFGANQDIALGLKAGLGLSAYTYKTEWKDIVLENKSGEDATNTSVTSFGYMAILGVYADFGDEKWGMNFGFDLVKTKYAKENIDGEAADFNGDGAIFNISVRYMI